MLTQQSVIFRTCLNSTLEVAGTLYPYAKYMIASEEVTYGANGFGDASAVGISMIGALIVEVILTCVFIYTILGVTADEKKGSVAGIVIGLTLTFVHILGIPLTGTSVNPARSLSAAIFSGATAMSQVWVFIVGPFVGAALAAVLYRLLNKEEK